MKVVIIGAKNPETGRMITAIRAHATDHCPAPEFIGFLDNNRELHGATFLGLPVFGGFELLDRFIAEGCLFVNTVGATSVARYETSMAVVARGGRFADFIHPTVERPASLGIGNYIQGSVHIQADVEIGDNAYINVGTVIAHQSRVGNSVFIAQLSSICGEVTIGDGVYIGTQVSILPRLTIGPWAIIGAGAVVLRDVPSHAVVVGNPARIVRYTERQHVDGRLLPSRS